MKNFGLALIAILVGLMLLSYQHLLSNLPVLSKAPLVFVDVQTKAQAAAPTKPKPPKPKPKPKPIVEPEKTIQDPTPDPVPQPKPEPQPEQVYEATPNIKPSPQEARVSTADIYTPIPSKQLPGTPVLLYGDEPVYPETAYDDYAEALITVKMLVDTTGHITKVEKLSGEDGYGFMTAIEVAVKTWRFEPVRVGGRARVFEYIKEFEFRFE